MSSLPGYTLEAYLMWNYDLVVDDDESANLSLQIAEALGTALRRRPRLTSMQFSHLVEIFEPFRHDVERSLYDFEEETMSWRDYAGCNFDFIPDHIYGQGMHLRDAIIPSPPQQEKETQ